MVSLNDFYILADAVAKKSLIGGTVTISERDYFANQAQLQIFEKDRAIFLKTKETSDYLELFLKNVIVSVPLIGSFPYPLDFEHTASMRSYYVKPDGKSLERYVAPVKNRDWGAISSSQLYLPTKQFPKYTEFNSEYRVLPRDIGVIMLDYFKTPQFPVWGFNVVNNRPVYDPLTTVNFEWDSFAIGEVLSAFLMLLGISIKDGELSAFANDYLNKTNSRL